MNGLDATALPVRDQPPRVLDRFRARYTLLFLAGLLLIQVYAISKDPESGPPLLITLMVLLYYLALIIFVVIATAINIYKLFWKRALSMALAPVLTFGFLSAELHTGFTPDYVHLLLARSKYMDQVRQAHSSEPSFYAWLWDRTWGVGITATQTVLIYDEADQLLLAPEIRSAAWTAGVLRFASTARVDLRSTMDPTPYSKRHDVPSVKKLADHFYLLNEVL